MRANCLHIHETSWYDDGDRLEPLASSIAAGGFTSSSTPNEAALILGNSNRTILNGFLLDNAVSATEAIQFATNEIELVLGGSGIHEVVLNPDDIITDIDFGNRELPPSEIQGSKWDDLNGDGIWDTGEPGLADWTIYLDENQNGQLDSGEISTVTDASGNYAFTDLVPGTYYVAEVPQATWKPTYPGLNRSFETDDFTGWQALGNASI